MFNLLAMKKLPITHLYASAIVAIAFVVIGCVVNPESQSPNAVSLLNNKQASTSDENLTKQLALVERAIDNENATYKASDRDLEAEEVNDDAASPLEDSTAASEQPLATTDDYVWKTETVRRGDTLSHIFKREGLSSKLIHQIIHDDPLNKKLSKLRPGQKIDFAFSHASSEGTSTPSLEKIRLELNRFETFIVTRDDDNVYRGHIDKLSPDIKLKQVSGKIRNSLFLSAKNAGLSENLTMRLAQIFGWDIDFALDIRSGDKFTVVYQELYLNGEKVRDGKIVAAKFLNQGKDHVAVLYENENGVARYYAPDGSSMRKAFLRTPIAFARISSHFNPRRRHPVLHRIRAHMGTDYAASRGTPIRATGDGKVLHAGRKGGYGKTVIIKHGHKYTTLYAHMHRYGKGIKNGARVRQGQVIGYVGSTGLATGPHLHYEFRVYGQHKNPVTVALPKADSIPRSKLNEFRLATKRHLAMLDQGREDNIQVAGLDRQ